MSDSIPIEAIEPDWARIVPDAKGTRTPQVLAAHRCPGCEILRSQCFCALIPRLDLKTRVTILMHTSEEVLPSNTARLAAKSLINSEIRINGRIGDRLEAKGLVDPESQPLLLYPSQFAIELTPEFVSTLTRPVNLIVPDGKWRQTMRFVRRQPVLQGVPHVRVPITGPSRYHLRSQSNDENLCTLEAIARALGVLESPDAQAQLEQVLNVMVTRTLQLRGKAGRWTPQ